MPAATQESASSRGRWLLLLALVLTVAIYARTFGFQFVYDDWTQIVRNSNLESARFIPVYFTEHSWIHLRPTGQGDYYRPIFLLWLFLNRSLFALWAPGWHAASLLLHLVAISLFYLVAAKLFRNSTAAGGAAFLFALHPANHESVAWVSSSSEPLMAVFLLAALLLHLRDRGRSSWTARGASACFFALALGCKETAIAFLPLLVLVERVFPSSQEPSDASTGTRDWARLLLQSIPYLGVALIYFAVRAHALHHVFSASPEIFFTTALYTAPSVLLLYLRHLVLPIHLSAWYDAPYVALPSSAGFLLPLLLLLAIGTALLLIVRRSRVAKFALAWLLLPLISPLAGIRFFADGDLLHDRYLYLSTMGFALFVAWLAQAAHSAFREPLATRLRIGVPLGAASLFAVSLALQLSQWQDNFTLYQNAVAIAPRSVIARDNLANELFKRKDTSGAIRVFQESLQIDPNSWKTNLALAVTYMTAGDLSNAEPYFHRAIAIDARNTNQYLLLANLQLRANRLQDAEGTLRRGLAMDSNSIGLHFQLGMVLLQRGAPADATAEFEKALALDPQSPAIQKQLAWARSLIQTGSDTPRH